MLHNAFGSDSLLGVFFRYGGARAATLAAFLIILLVTFIHIWIGHTLSQSALERSRQLVTQLHGEYLLEGAAPQPSSNVIAPIGTVETLRVIVTEQGQQIPQKMEISDHITAMAQVMNSTSGYEAQFLDATFQSQRAIFDAQWLLLGRDIGGAKGFVLVNMFDERRLLDGLLRALWMTSIMIFLIALITAFVLFRVFYMSTRRVALFLASQKEVQSLHLDIPSDISPALSEVQNAALEAIERLNSSQRIQKDVLGTIPHDLNCALNHFQTGLDRINRELRMEKITPYQARDHMAQTGTTLLGTLRQLQDLQTDLFAQIRNVGDHSVDTFWAAHGEALRKTLELSDLTLKADMARQTSARFAPALLAMVLQNLFENAGKYTKPGGTLSIRTCEKEDGVEIEVINEPTIGLTFSRGAEVGDLWARSDEAIASGQHGSGAGLHATKRRMESMGGNAEFYGEGTQFIARLFLSGH